MRPSPLYMGSCLLVVLFWCGACTGARGGAETQAAVQDERLRERQHYYSATYQNRLSRESYHYFDKTEVDLEYDRLEPPSRYQRPRGVRGYVYDTTEVDLAITPQKETTPAAPSQSGKD
jgi:hypothetical protein